jgi:hypothetical protein
MIYKNVEKPRPRAYDLQMYQQLARKANFQEQFLTGNYTGRTMEDVGGEVHLNSRMFELGKAMSTGNPDALKKIKVEHDLRTFNMLERNFQVTQSKQTRQADFLEYQTPILQKKAQLLDRDIKAWEKATKGENAEEHGAPIQIADGELLDTKEKREAYFKQNPDLLPLVGKKITIGGIETELKVETGAWMNTETGRISENVPRFEYRLAGAEHRVPIANDGVTTAKAFISSFASRARYLKSDLERTRGDIEANGKTLAALREELKQKSPYIDKIEKMEQEIKEIDSRLHITGPEIQDEGAAPDEDTEAAEKPVKKATAGTTLRSGFLDPELAKATAATVRKEYDKEIKPFLDKAGKTLTAALSEIQHIIAPRAGVEEKALSSIMRMTGEREKHRFTLNQVLDKARTMFGKLPREQQIDFIDRYKQGEDQATPELSEIAKFFAKTDEDTYRNVIEAQIGTVGGWAERAWKKLPEDAKVELIHSLEDYRGEGQQDAIEKLLEDHGIKSTKMMQIGLANVADSILSYKENHYRVLWKTVPGKIDEETGEIVGVKEKGVPQPGAKRPLQGNKGFLKQSTLDDMSEGLERGGEPFSYNPVEMFERGQDDSWCYITALKMWNDAEKLGGRVYVPSGQRGPDGFTRIEDRIGDVRFPAQSGEGFIEGGHWYLRDDWARLMNNYLGPDAIRGSAVGRGIMDVKNRLTAWRLAMSPFHALTECGLSMASQFGHGLATAWNLGVRHGELGMIGEGAVEALKTPIGPYRDVRLGTNVIRYLTNKEEFLKTTRGQDFLKDYPDADRMITELFASGAKLGMHEDERVRGIEGMRQAAADDKYIEAIIRAAGGTQGLIQKPLFNYYVPRIKAGMFMRDYSRELADHQADIDADRMTRAEIGRKVWDAIEDTAGQMNWDARFWKRTFKSSIQLFFRAFTWRAGNARLAYKAATGQAGEVLDSLKAIKDHFDEGERARPSSNPIPRIDPNVARILGLLVTYGAVNALIQLGTTGEKPRDYKDLLAARIGGNDSYGHPLRITAPAILLSDWMSLQAHGLKGYISSGASDLVGGLDDVLANKDFRNVMIHDPEDPFYKQRWGDVQHVVGSPISVSNARNLRAEGASKGKAASMLLGLKAVPQSFDMTPAERLAQEINRNKIPTRTPQEAEENDKKRQTAAPIREAMRTGNRLAVSRAVAQGEISPRQAANIIREGKRPLIVNAIGDMTLEQAEKVYAVASPKEKQELDRFMRVKFGRGLRNAPAQDREKIKSDYSNIIRTGSRDVRTGSRATASRAPEERK